MNELCKKVPIAKRKGDKLKWDLKLEKIKAYKKAYHHERKNTFKTVKNKRFLEEEGILYLLVPNEERFQASLESALKIAGVSHVLALLLAKGEGGSREYFQHQNNISKNLFKKNKMEYTQRFEEIIEKFGIHVGNIPASGGNVSWLFSPMTNMKRETLKSMYSSEPKKFYIVENKLYFLAPIQHFVEKMFMEGVKVAGGENALAKALATNEAEEKRYRMAFKRMSFRTTKSFTYYSHLFAEYLQKNRPIFEKEDEHAKSA